MNAQIRAGRLYVDGKMTFLYGIGQVEAWPWTKLLTQHLGLPFDWPKWVGLRGTKEAWVEKQLEVLKEAKINTINGMIDPALAKKWTNYVVPILIDGSGEKNPNFALKMEMATASTERRKEIFRKFADQKLPILSNCKIIAVSWGNEMVWEWLMFGAVKTAEEAITAMRECSLIWWEMQEDILPSALFVSEGIANTLSSKPGKFDFLESAGWTTDSFSAMMSWYGVNADFISLHNYSRWNIEEVAAMGKAFAPIWMSEFSWVCPLNLSKRRRETLGWPVARDQTERRVNYYKTVSTARKSNGIIGTAWFNYADVDGINFGLIDPAFDRVYKELMEAMISANGF